MEDLAKRLNELKSEYESVYEKLDIKKKSKELSILIAESQDPEFWLDSQVAQDKMKKQAALQSFVSPWEGLQKSIEELSDMVSFNDETLADDLSEQFSSLENTMEALKEGLKFSGSYDGHDVIMTIYSGAGGTDAQDWASMLFRMYVRWAEDNDLTISLIEEAAGDVAGLKRAVLEISGAFAFGRLKSEAGVHRLVRLSPFNSDNLRQTSFARVDIVPKIDSPSEVEIDDKDLRVDVYRAGGHGGQSVNTTDSAVRITHLPTGVVVSIQNERSQVQNKDTAMTILRSRLVALQLEQHKDKVSELKGPNKSAEWGNQIRSYVLHPYKQVKDLRTRYETSNVDGVLDGDLDPFMSAYLEYDLGKNEK